ncbi:MAG TPA: flavin reductase [Actinobacteria bacterium]|nr:flavin reductase [Actinomycetota bacterium]
MIHEGEHPFEEPEERRDPIRRFRGRLAEPVCVVTAGIDDDRAGLTVGSLVVSEGEPARVHLLVGPLSDFYEVLGRSGRFVVHVLDASRTDLAELFAGRRPGPGGPFASVAFEDSPWGPVLTEVANRAYCSYYEGTEQGWSVLVTGDVDRVELADLDDPLVHFRGRYRRLLGDADRR